jgi:DegV family protein with EDD domain
MSGTGQRVRVFTDSVCDAPEEVLRELGVTVVPVTVRFGEQEYRDRVDISMEEFMNRLQTTSEPVKTSQPSPGAFVEAFREACEKGDPIVSVQASSRLSGTYQSACIARDILAGDGYRIGVVDSQTASMGQGWAVIEAARAALLGHSLERVMERAKEIALRTKVLLTVDSLHYLQRNGRLGRVQAVLGSLLHLKPILTVRDGELSLAETAVGGERAMDRLVLAIRKVFKERARVSLAVVHAAARDRADQLMRELSRIYDVVDSIISETGPAIAANTGPGSFGAMLYEVD